MIRRVDRYELLEQVGTGGMAVVYRGRDTALDREVAVKLLHPHLAARAESRARFSREARAVARLSHPNIVEIYDYAGDAAVESYLVTEFVHGRTLRAFAEEEGVGFPEVGALLARALADALVHAHSAGVIHRDLKPENVLVLEAGGRRAVKLVDFGIARIVASDEKMTMTGALVGSPNHMAPEIIEGREADARSDLFSLGTILYWLTTGKMPFAAPNPTATLRRVIEGTYDDPREVSPLVPDALAGVIARALVPDPEGRTATAAALRDELDEALAASGLDDPEVELQSFLAAPAPYKDALRGRLVAFALARADAALGRGETARGMGLLNRVLALDPDNAAVEARLDRISFVARWKRRVRRASGALVALGLLGA
ncbi:MAG TPA: serine/threonine-protein kinase, partial [Anaeromyxobacteraceae bacterium]